EVVTQFAEAMAAGAKFPPVVVFDDGEIARLVDGDHRCAAARKNNETKIEAIVYPGGWREAMLYAIAGNVSHGIPLTLSERRKAVERLLADESWSQWTDSAIGRWCGLSNKTIATIRKETGLGNSQTRSYATASGKTVRRRAKTERRPRAAVVPTLGLGTEEESSAEVDPAMRTSASDDLQKADDAATETIIDIVDRLLVALDEVLDSGDDLAAVPRERIERLTRKLSELQGKCSLVCH
ncbi:MAG: hypothetical protein JWN40_2107, partial [Phycisphaerales bacterium]|nr:hypothetical protein [Phycisphaerales bacterium]